MQEGIWKHTERWSVFLRFLVSDDIHNIHVLCLDELSWDAKKQNSCLSEP